MDKDAEFVITETLARFEDFGSRDIALDAFNNLRRG